MNPIYGRVATNTNGHNEKNYNVVEWSCIPTDIILVLNAVINICRNVHTLFYPDVENLIVKVRAVIHIMTLETIRVNTKGYYPITFESLRPSTLHILHDEPSYIENIQANTIIRNIKDTIKVL